MPAFPWSTKIFKLLPDQFHSAAILLAGNKGKIIDLFRDIISTRRTISSQCKIFKFCGFSAPLTRFKFYGISFKPNGAKRVTLALPCSL